MKKKALIIVESPAKMKTLKKFLSSDYTFESSIGHIRDLPEKDFGIDLENDFEPFYVTMPDKLKVIEALKAAAKKVDVVYLSTDPDREGEAIAWHIAQILPPDTKTERVSFNSFTKKEVLEALNHPRGIDYALVNAQQARRLLDRIVGYKISPILNRRIQRGRDSFVSAGRVQSVALKLVVDREKEIRAFIPVEYWNIGAVLKKPDDDKIFRAGLYSVDGKRVEKEAAPGKDFTIINNKEAADEVIKKMRQVPYKVKSVEKKEKKRNPVPPFITSTLQQEASRHFGFSSTRTMSIAQGLYEGIDLGKEGAEGLITYMRTDSVRVAPEALEGARSFILKNYGEHFLPDSPRVYTSKKSAQDAHEAIRPTNLEHPPEVVEPFLTRDQFMLYQLIWRRFLASQMMPAIYDTVSADIMAGSDVMLRATGSTMKFQGFLAVYEEKEDETEESEDKMLPELTEGQILKELELTSEQSFTRPPPRFSEASLVKELEKSGIGRPATYASIMNKIQSRDYTVKESGRLKPTELGEVIAQMLENHFSKIMDIGFTSSMEDDLELIAENHKDWRTLIRDFWTEFAPTLEIAEKEAFVPKVLTEIECPKCHEGRLQKVWYKSRYFYGCERYPDCDYSAPLEALDFNKEDYADNFDWEQTCPVCQSEMKVRWGRFGAFLGCLRFPECKGIINIPRKGEVAVSNEDMPACPAIDCPGKMVARKSRFGKTFYSCSTFPECDVIVNQLDQLSEKYPSHVRTAYVKKPRGRKATKATKEKAPAKEKKKAKRVTAPLHLSKELAAIVGAKEMGRGDVIKHVWDYIKAKGLQGETNKRIINPDASLAKIIGPEPIDMFKLAGLLSPHMKKE